LKTGLKTTTRRPTIKNPFVIPLKQKTKRPNRINFASASSSPVTSSLKTSYRSSEDNKLQQKRGSTKESLRRKSKAAALAATTLWKGLAAAAPHCHDVEKKKTLPMRKHKSHKELMHEIEERRRLPKTQDMEPSLQFELNLRVQNNLN